MTTASPIVHFFHLVKSFPGRIWRIFRAQLKGRSRWKQLLIIGLWMVGSFITTSLLATLVYGVLPVPLTPLMVIRSVEQWADGEKAVLKKDWVSMDEISIHLAPSVMCAEDQNFKDHWGFDLEAIQKALEHNKRSRRTRGASTISQQTAKNVFLWPHRSWLRKGLEIYFTGLIELVWTKRRIMTVYLNVVEFGPGIYGAEAAARHFFRKPADKLTRSEAATLAAVLPNPRKYSASRPGRYVTRRRDWVLRQMRMHGSGIYLDKAN
ncbi:MAG: monofunctional biosynthetic peptidoglycan transglycosylase [Saprospiraceae bacterium]|nr:monofunctional biosynthetic peptidoglycan transglycosylase [Saprospiraceae bacterium]